MPSKVRKLLARSPKLSVQSFEPVLLEDIPVLETGIDYPASTGAISLTPEMLAEAVLSQDDPHVQPPRIKIGHSDNPINDDLQQLWEDVNDGRDESKPAMGTINNLRTENNGHTLVGDYWGMPAWLADILATAYPARSIEGGHWHNTANGKEYSFTIEAVSFLGVVGPGCTSLDDLQVLFSEEGPKVTVIEMARPKTQQEGTPVPVELQTNVADIRRAFYDDFAQGDRYWWWDRELLVDPFEFIVEDPDEGQLYVVPFTVNGEGADNVEFGEPAPVRVEYKPDEKASEPVAANRPLLSVRLNRAGTVLAVNDKPEREQSPPANQEDETMDSVRERLGLPEDATEEQVLQAVADLQAAGSDPAAADDPPAADPDPDDNDDDDSEDADDDEVEAPEGDGTVKVDAEEFATLRRQAQEGATARSEQVAAHRATVLAGAQSEGRFPPSRLAHWQRQYEADPEGTETLLTASVEEGGLAPGTVPVTEVGGSPAGDEASTAYDPSWLSKAERARIEAAGSGSGRVYKEEVKA